MKQLFGVIYIRVLLVCFLRLICIFVFVLIWRVYQKTKNRGVSQLGLFWYLMSISRWFGEVSVYCPFCPTVEAARCEGRQVQPLRQRPLLFFIGGFGNKLTHICFDKYFAHSLKQFFKAIGGIYTSPSLVVFSLFLHVRFS